MRKVADFLLSMLRNNLLLKIMSLLFAVVLWSYVLAETNPARERMIPNVPVRYDHTEDLKSKNLAISGSLSDALDTVDVRVKVNQSDLKYLNTNPASVKAYADLSTINGKGEQTVKITWTTDRGQVLEVSPSSVKLYIDDYVTRTVPVSLNVTGRVPDGYNASAPKAVPDVVTISGAKVDVEKAASAVCNINLNGLTESFNKSVETTILDSSGNALDSGLFEGGLPSVIVSFDVLPKKTVTVDVASAILGQDRLAPGYEVAGITCSPESVEIIGKADVLSSMNSVALVPYSVSGASGDVVVLLDYSPPEGVSVLKTEKVQVTITIREITGTKTYKGVGIDQKNLAKGLAAKLAQSEVNVTVVAGTSRLSLLNRSDIVPYVDLDGLDVGTYTLDVLFEIPNGFSRENFTASVGTITVTISKG